MTVNIAKLLMITFVSFLVAAPAFAASNTWSLDMTHSVARIYLGSASDPMSFQAGVTPIVGSVALNGDDPAASVMNFELTGDTTTTLSFRSLSATLTPDGDLWLTGDLTLTQVSDAESWTAGEGYYGPIYVEGASRSVTNRVDFLVPAKSMKVDRSGTIEVVASSAIGLENFPELPGAVRNTSWPKAVIEDEQCTPSTSVGEDYDGTSCTGTVVESATNEGAPLSTVGEDFDGLTSKAPAGNQVTIALYLKYNPRYASANSEVAQGR